MGTQKQAGCGDPGTRAGALSSRAAVGGSPRTRVRQWLPGREPWTGKGIKELSSRAQA